MNQNDRNHHVLHAKYRGNVYKYGIYIYALGNISRTTGPKLGMFDIICHLK